MQWNLSWAIRQKVTPFGGKLLCGHEGGLPYKLDPFTLETIGIESFGGALNEGLGERFLAHTRIDNDKGLLLGVSKRCAGGYWGGISQASKFCAYHMFFFFAQVIYLTLLQFYT